MVNSFWEKAAISKLKSMCFWNFELDQYQSNKAHLFPSFSSIKTEPDEYEYDFESKPIRYKGIADLYFELPNEAIIVNTIGAALVGLAILMPCILKCDAFRKGLKNEADEDDSDIEWTKNYQKMPHRRHFFILKGVWKSFLYVFRNFLKFLNFFCNYKSDFKLSLKWKKSELRACCCRLILKIFFFEMCFLPFSDETISWSLKNEKYSQI